MKSIAARVGWVILALVLVLLVVAMTWEPFAAREGRAPATTRTYTAEIIRDDFGVPHIYGQTDPDVAYGVAIAHSEDDFFTLQDVVAMARGRYGAIAGEDGAQVDFMYHLLDARGTARREYPALPADTRALFEAYATGLNDYAAAHPGEVKLAKLFPVDGEDVAAGFALRQPFFFGLAGVIGPLVAGEPLSPEQGPAILPTGNADSLPGDAPAIMQDEDTIPGDAPPVASRRALPLHMGRDGANAGSNAFAVTPEKSGGPTMLVSNSHQPWRGGVAWYELVVESEDGWHYAGANFPGSPFPFLGHNEDLGWTNTVNTPDMVDIYELTVANREVDGEDALMYELDGEWRPLDQRTVTLPVRVGPVVLPIRRTIYRSVHGPVIRNADGYFAIRYGGIGNLGQLDAYYRLNKASTLEEWQAILARMDIPSTNFIYADAQGNIANIYNAALPDRPARVDGRLIDWRGILPGNDSALIWDGPVAYERLPRMVNPGSGWLVETNDNPFKDAGPGSDLSADDFAPELGVELKQTASSGWNGWLSCLVFDDSSVRDRTMKRLDEANIESRPLWKPMHLQPVYQGYACVGGGVAEHLFADGLCLPSGSNLQEEDLERIVEIVRRTSMEG